MIDKITLGTISWK